ncbi:hypothetical protein AHAS_Ahas07G0086400 [Arachis hypogaea]
MTSSSLRPPQSEPRPEPQTTNSVQVTEPCNEDMDLEANEVDSFDKHIDRMFATSSAEKRKGRKTTEFWDGDLIDFDGIVKQAKMSVQEAMEWSLNGSKIEKISEIEQLDETTRILSENDSLSQALNKEHSVRVRGIGIGPTLSQLFRLSSQPSVDRAQIEEAQRMLCELQAEVMAEKLKRKAMEDEVAAEEMNRQAIESVLSYLVQQQGGELPPDIVARMNSLDGHDGK